VLTLAPASIVLARQICSILKSPRAGVHCPCNPCTTKLKAFFCKRQRKFADPQFCLKIALLLGGWVWVSRLSYGIYCNLQESQVWDPFHILGASVFSSSTIIRRCYKRKSLQYHPDKRPKWMAKEAAEAIFIDLTKAYKA